jgi:hypothetical protein
MKKFLDKKIYDKAKEIADKTYKKHSAYKSMFLISKYEELGGRINPEAKKKSGTEKWNKEVWKNLTPLATGNIKKIKDLPACGMKGKKQGKLPSICRPTKKIDSKTPTLAQEYTKGQIKKALEIKKKGKTINWKEL